MGVVPGVGWVESEDEGLAGSVGVSVSVEGLVGSLGGVVGVLVVGFVVGLVVEVGWLLGGSVESEGVGGEAVEAAVPSVVVPEELVGPPESPGLTTVHRRYREREGGKREM